MSDSKEKQSEKLSPEQELKEQAAKEAKAKLVAIEASYSGTGYVVAPGKALTVLRGVVAEGKVIGPLDFKLPEDFEARVKDGHIVTDPDAKKK